MFRFGVRRSANATTLSYLKATLLGSEGIEIVEEWRLLRAARRAAARSLGRGRLVSEHLAQVVLGPPQSHHESGQWQVHPALWVAAGGSRVGIELAGVGPCGGLLALASAQEDLVVDDGVAGDPEVDKPAEARGVVGALGERDLFVDRGAREAVVEERGEAVGGVDERRGEVRAACVPSGQGAGGVAFAGRAVVAMVGGDEGVKGFAELGAVVSVHFHRGSEFDGLEDFGLAGAL